MAWDFTLRDERGDGMGLVSKNWTSLSQEFFTDAGRFYLQFRYVISSAATFHEIIVSGLPGQSRELDFAERQMALALAISIDLDYFTR